MATPKSLVLEHKRWLSSQIRIQNRNVFHWSKSSQLALAPAIASSGFFLSHSKQRIQRCNEFDFTEEYSKATN